MINYLIKKQEQLEEQKLLKEKERMGIEKFRHKLLLKIAEENNKSVYGVITFPSLNDLINEVYREFGYE